MVNFFYLFMFFNDHFVKAEEGFKVLSRGFIIYKETNNFSFWFNVEVTTRTQRVKSVRDTVSLRYKVCFNLTTLKSPHLLMESGAVVCWSNQLLKNGSVRVSGGGEIIWTCCFPPHLQEETSPHCDLKNRTGTKENRKCRRLFVIPDRRRDSFVLSVVPRRSCRWGPVWTPW